jgi:pyridinium-3,5-bisthiocarboxylic acid mononucleotide nickel chelatase
VQMKKNRPGTLLTVIGPPDRRAALSEIVFKETTTIGLRYAELDRECLTREIVSVDTPLGPVRFKLAWRDGRLVNAVPEFDDCARLAGEQQLPVKEVHTIAVKAFDRGRS